MRGYPCSFHPGKLRVCHLCHQSFRPCQIQDRTAVRPPPERRDSHPGPQGSEPESHEHLPWELPGSSRWREEEGPLRGRGEGLARQPPVLQPGQGLSFTSLPLPLSLASPASLALLSPARSRRGALSAQSSALGPEEGTHSVLSRSHPSPPTWEPCVL